MKTNVSKTYSTKSKFFNVRMKSNPYTILKFRKIVISNIHVKSNT